MERVQMIKTKKITQQNSMSEGNKDTNDTGANIWWFVIINL